jgi:bifunctional non-homologous end joining protein LigD
MGRPGEGGGLVWAGNVGSGFTEAALRDLLGRLGPLVTPDPPLSDWTRVPGARRGEVTWVAPRLRGRVRFAEWTRDRVMRAPVWQGLLEDAPAPAPPAAPAAPPARRVRITNRDKPYFPEEGITKGDLVDYYRAIAPALVPHLRERPFTMIRRPDGIAGAHFFQKDRPPHMPDWIPVAPLPSGSGPGHRVIRFPVVNDADALVWMANAGCVDMNHWYSRRDMPGHPDYVLFDLDPAEGSGFREAVRVALLVREVLGLLGLVGYAKTSSARGLHVMVPVDRVHTFEEARAFCRLVGSALEQTHRGLVTTEWAKERRRGVLVDANQVAYAKTISSVYSVRPRPGAPVSTPLEWDEVDEELDPRELTMAVALDRVQRRGDLFAPVLAGGQRLGPAIARIRGANP